MIPSTSAGPRSPGDGGSEPLGDEGPHPTGHGGPRISAVEALAYRIPTGEPESDGTLRWSSTGMVVARVAAGGVEGTGYAYTHPTAAAAVVREPLAAVVEGRPALDVAAAWEAMRHRMRNVGVGGVVSSAISAVDAALWDLKGRLLDMPLAVLLGRRRERVAVYGSGGFTSMAEPELRDQLAGWVDAGIGAVKMKVGREPERDGERVRAVRAAVGPDVTLMVDANGALDRREALSAAEVFWEAGVTWFEEPVSSDDLEGLRLLRDRCPGGMEITAGEYGWELSHFRDLLQAGAVDVVQADVTRCGGVTAFLQAAELCEAFQVPLSAHTAPSLHLHPCLAAPRVRHVEYFHDHQRIERMLFDGFTEPSEGLLRAHSGRPGHGLVLKEEDAEEFRIT